LGEDKREVRTGEKVDEKGAERVVGREKNGL
jgi:hypothetical protein